MTIYKQKKYHYLPYVIIDKYLFFYDKHENFKNKLYDNIKKLNYTLFIIYSFGEKKTNEILYEYLIYNKPKNFQFSYTDYLYTNIDKLPSAYPEVFSCVYPNIVNYIRIENSKNIKSARKIIEDEKEEINNYINEFYGNDELKLFCHR